MPRNIVIFSDGTGQRGGVFFDENRSNIYKLYRATRCGPDSTVDPAQQLTFYDPGLGTRPIDRNFLYKQFLRLHNIFSRATGLGITLNMVECYAAVIRLWEPGDRIFLFGFSRGAYTVRALAGVLSFCGVPTTLPDGNPVPRDERASIRIARRAVKQVYQFTESRLSDSATPRQRARLEQRELIARRFRAAYGSNNEKDDANAIPHFIGVFDTVSSIGNPIGTAGLLVGISAFLGLAALVLSLAAMSFPAWAAILFGAAIVVAAGWYVVDHLKIPGALPGYSAKESRHWAAFKMRFYDLRLSTRIPYARHAMAIDENRRAFDRVPWRIIGDPRQKDENGVLRFEQLWFAGNHSDVGGSYAENDSRLSDIALKWMVEAAASVGLIYDKRWLNLFPDPAGPQHDESRAGIFRYTSRPFTRSIEAQAVVHPSVLERLDLPGVLQYDTVKPYRPEGLRNHDLVRDRYKDV